jgi:hypothetical protein
MKTPEVKENKDYNLAYCAKCIQSTNHLDGVCQKCLPEPVAGWKESRTCCTGCREDGTCPNLQCPSIKEKICNCGGYVALKVATKQFECLQCGFVFDTPPITTKVEWEKEFDERFGTCNGGDALYAKVDDDGLSVKQYLKSFISKVEQQAYERGKRERDAEIVEEMIEIAKTNRDNYSDYRKTINENALLFLEDFINIINKHKV